MLILKDILDKVHERTKLLILDESTDSYIYKTDNYDGYVPPKGYYVEGILLHDGALLITVKPQ